MTVGATVGQAILSVVTFIVATKTLGVRSCWRFHVKTGEDLSRGRNDLMSHNRTLRVGVAKKGIFLRESRFGDERGSRRGWSGRDLRC